MSPMPANAARRPALVRGQHGQVIPLTLVFLVAVILSLWVLYDAGQVNTEKMRLQNTADAGAYSAANVVARDLNFIAYTNRAMVANQVAIGQTVGLVSWISMMEQTSENLDTLGDIAKFIPYIGIAINAITTWMETTMEFLKGTIEAYAKAAIQVNDAVIGSMSTSQKLYHVATIAAAAQVLTEVTEDNDPDVRQVLGVGDVSLITVATMVAELQDAMGGIDQIERPTASTNSANDDYRYKRFQEFQSIVIASEDPFTYQRSYSWGSGSLGLLSIRLPKYGGSEFDARIATNGHYKWEWTSMDDVSQQWKLRVPIFEDKKLEVPMGWGAAHALNTDAGAYFDYYANRSDSRYGDGAWKNDIAAASAGSFYANNNFKGVSDGGLRPFYDFKDDGTGYDAGPAVTVLIAKDDIHLRTQAAMDKTIEGFDVNATANTDIYTEQYGGTSGGHISALSKAQPYFYRPHEANGSVDTWLRRKMDGLDSELGPAMVPNGDPNQFEHGNLYGPFWQTRLMDTTDAERVAALALSEQL